MSVKRTGGDKAIDISLQDYQNIAIRLAFETGQEISKDYGLGKAALRREFAKYNSLGITAYKKKIGGVNTGISKAVEIIQVYSRIESVNKISKMHLMPTALVIIKVLKLFGYRTVLGSSGYKLIKNTEPSKYDFLLR